MRALSHGLRAIVATVVGFPPERRFARLLRWRIVYDRSAASILVLYGLYHWAVAINVVEGPVAGGFRAMGGAWQLATINFAVALPVAAVGLWTLMPWGLAIWLYAAGAQIAMSTIFDGTFGFDLPAVVFHLVGLGILAGLMVLTRRYQPEGDAVANLAGVLAAVPPLTAPEPTAARPSVMRRFDATKPSDSTEKQVESSRAK